MSYLSNSGPALLPGELCASSWGLSPQEPSKDPSSSSPAGPHPCVLLHTPRIFPLASGLSTHTTVPPTSSPWLQAWVSSCPSSTTPHCRAHLAPGTAAPGPPHTSACNQTPRFHPAGPGGPGTTRARNKPFPGSWPRQLGHPCHSFLGLQRARDTQGLSGQQD